MQKITFHYEPDVCRFWLGVQEGIYVKEIALRHNMDLDDLIHCLKCCAENVRKHNEVD